MALLGKLRKGDRKSVYSVVSCSDLTPGSLEVWVDLPDEIKYDPSLAPFKNLYEQHHGKLDIKNLSESDDETFDKKIADLRPIDEKIELNHDNKTNGSRLRLPAEAEVDEQKEKSRRKIQILKLARIFKLSVLVSGWILLTLALILNTEKSDTVLHTAVKTGEVKEYNLPMTEEKVQTLITLTGPFQDIPDNNTSNVLQLWLRRAINIDGLLLEQNSSTWSVHLQPDEKLDFSKSIAETNTLYINLNRNTSNVEVLRSISNVSGSSQNGTAVSLCISTTSNVTVPFTLNYQMNPIGETEGLVYASFLLISLYLLIIFEIVNRTIAALLSSTLGIAVLAICGARPSLPELVSWLDVETLLLLFSMMLLVAIMAETGLFDYLAVLAFEVTGGRTWPLINCLCLFTAVFSTFLDNVTTVLLMTPVTIRLCEVMQLNPVPILMCMVIFSNVGGAATPVGDPPNVIIASHPAILRENINFASFTVHMGLGILLVSIQTYIQLRFIFRDMNKLRHSVPIDIQELRQEIAVWRRAAASLSSYSRDEDLVRRALEKKVERLNTTLSKREAGGGTSKSDPRFCTTLAHMKEKYRIRDKQLLIKAAVSVSFVVVVFFLHAFPELQRLSLGWTALLGALLLLVLAEKEDLEPVLARVEWSTLLFFAALFVLMEVLSKLGLIAWIGKITESLILQVGEESRLAVAIVLMLWVSGLTSAFVDNIPLTTMMIRVTVALADPGGLALPLAPLAWALSFGACLGGNGTLIGASANVVCAGVAEQHGYRFTFMQFLKIGFPVMIGNLLVATAYLLLCHCVCTWH
ncbi:P protein [Amyelois transitella]|uniref:P protein n=1 Tax=Amyelois transitella TaxID=680683 RepID=UPI00298FA3D4|nr:P protein [Amyelois transitella]XP_060808926.1 P protein [Amyelois transitella]XP_060808927.1 P protein [Amyelois transitella]